MRPRRPLTAEQQAKSDARRAQFKTLAQRIGAMTAEQQAAMAAKMAGAMTIEGRGLSVHNACLIACQRPDATIIGGFQQWRTAGRQVRKGEHGLMIWAPVRRNERGEIHESAFAPGVVADGDGTRPRFIMVTVFDVSQTDALEAEVAR